MAEIHDRIRDYWDADASTYDETKSHAISDPVERAAWRQVLREALPEPGATILDIGAGTGALTLLAAELGYRVTALDLSDGMLAKAREKAEAAGFDVEFVVAPGTEPPPGPFDAVMERHVLWTMPDPVPALARWREVAPQGRLVLFEGIWGGWSLARRPKEIASRMLRRAYGTPPDHHGPYPDDVLPHLPLLQLPTPRPLVDAVHDAGWRRLRLKRMRDVEWAARIHEPWPLGWLEELPRYALIAEA